MRTQLQEEIKERICCCIPTKSPHFRKYLRSEKQLSLYNVLRMPVHMIGSEMHVLRLQGKEKGRSIQRDVSKVRVTETH